MNAAQISPSTVNSSRRALTVRVHQFVGVLVRDGRGDAATAITASAMVILMSQSVTGSIPCATGFSIGRLESC